MKKYYLFPRLLPNILGTDRQCVRSMSSSRRPTRACNHLCAFTVHVLGDVGVSYDWGRGSAFHVREVQISLPIPLPLP